MVVLSVEGIDLSFGGVKALDGVSVQVKEGEIHAIIGPNGAGKTSLLNCINGLNRPDKGTIYYMGNNITGLRPSKICQIGISRMFQNIKLFEQLTVLENILLGTQININYSSLASILYYGKCFREELKQRRWAEEIIDFLELEAVRRLRVRTLPYGIQKKVELARALASKPRVLLADEPMSGMNVEEKQDMARYLTEINLDLKTTVILVEHDMQVIMDISDTITVLNFGRVIAEGSPEHVRNNPEVIEAHLGKKERLA